MTVRELESMLSKIKNKDRDVLRAKDDEGNGFDYVSCTEEMRFGTTLNELDDIRANELSEGYEPEDVGEGSPVLVIW